MKKILSLLIICLSILIFTACNKDNNSKEDEIKQEETTIDITQTESQISKKEKNIETQIVFTLDTNNPNLSYFDIYGKIEKLTEPISYDGIYASNKLSLTKDAQISFTTKNKMLLTIYSMDSNDKKIIINNKEYSIIEDKISIEIEAGDYSINPYETFITCISLNEISTNIQLFFSEEQSIVFNINEVEITKENNKTIYKFNTTNSIIEKLDNEEYAKIISTGTNKILNEIIKNIQIEETIEQNTENINIENN